MKDTSKDGKYTITTNDSIKLSEKSYLYKHQEPETHEKTKIRLLKMEQLGMQEVGFANFGVKNIMSGLYIEMVWNYSDNDFQSYIEWVKSLIDKANEEKSVKSKDADSPFVDEAEKVLTKSNKS